MKKNHRLAYLLATRLAVSLVLASAPITAATAETPAPRARLRVGTSGDYNPFSFHDATGEVSGFDVAVGRRLAADLGRDIELVPFRWPDLVTALRDGHFDIAMSGVTVRPERAVQLVFTRPYAVTGAVAVIRATDRKKFRTVADLDRPELHIAVNAGGHLEQVARRQFAQAQLTPVTANTELPDLLQSGAVDAAISEEFEARTWPAGRFVTRGPFTRDRKAYALPRAATDLQRTVDEWLAAREADGWLNAQRRRWLGAAAVQTPQQAGFEALTAAMDLRLQLMPLVAAVKRRDGLPIHDPAQEARVLEHVSGAAEAAGLNADDVAAVFQVQMEMANAVEQDAAEGTPGATSLADLRPAIASISDQIVSELARCQPWLGERRWRTQLDRTVRAGLTAPDVRLTALLQAVHRVHRRAH